MTPERAREISDAAFTAWETSDDSMQDAFTAAILTACAEERASAVADGDVEYRGNSVGYIHQKMTAYRLGIDRAWDALRELGFPPTGEVALCDQIKAAIANTRRAALTEAVASVDEAAAIPQGLSYDQRIAIKGVALRLLALKDKEEA